MKKKCKILFIIASLALTLSLMSNTYSRYVANTTGNLDMLFANWQILVNENDILDETSSSIQITPVILENEHISQNKVAPSTQGYFDINIDPTNVDVSFAYQIDIEVLNENLPDLMITKYAILDSDYTEGDEIITNTLENKKIVDYKGIVTGESLIGSNVYKDLFSGVRDVVGGRTSKYEEEIQKAREVALTSMKEKAQSLDANAIIGLKISYDNLGGTMGNTILVTAYGTAVKCE